MAYLGPLTYPGPGLYPVAFTDGTSGVYPATLTGHLDFAPRPRVDVVFQTLNPAAVTITVYRQATQRQLPVRGGMNLAVAGGAAVVDLEAPSGVPLIYVAQMFDEDGVFIGTTGTAQITLNAPDTWVQNPFDPAGALRVRVGIGTGQQITAGVTLTPVYPAGRRAGIGIGGQRHGITNVPLTLYADSVPQAQALDAMFGTVNGDLGLPPFLVVCFSAKLAQRLQLPQPLIVGVGAPTRTLVNAAGGGTLTAWDVSGPELDPPAAGLVQAVYSRDDMDAAFGPRDTRDAAYLTRIAMDTDYNHSGSAGDGTPDSGVGGGDAGGTPGTPTDTSPVPAGTWGDGIYGDGVYGAPTT